MMEEKKTKETVKLEGEVTESLPNAMFRVKLDDGELVLAHVAGKLRRSFIRIMPGDRVRMETSPLDKTKGRIVWRVG